MDGLNNLNVLFLEDNEEFAANMTEFLGIYFRNVYHVDTIKEAINSYNDNKIDVIISDIKIKAENGLEFVQFVRTKNKEIPIIIFSAHKDEEFLFKAIPLNIFSYELKPFSYKKIAEVLKKLSDRFSDTNLFSIKDGVQYNFGNKMLYINDEAVKLTKREILFLELMMKNKGEVVTNDMIQRGVWEEKFMSDAAIKNLIFRLRKKVSIPFVETIQSVGYKL